ncbi:MAG: ABC transporter substrate-binding protein [Candidatus Dactylopiibacterium carminicum]|uniref:ABC transporter substrate-binding protein n=1 Tax=Candidatus Dactylopiibacterium carminicum TaxID=857335 RepID=A0A272ERR0_9RHOO|nr:ABC transporter substrate-binding protein [Candidatus Dactylopiibacterium carminicum]KAF7598869.1 ABC transporter substrate-binding protein [Candidatus Dactylopiibacterium carminicum]PAS92785.1 MAG: ABC transporter substrate-binding protein [Candidatus Dactylopiibacterium carminicum]
MKIARHCSALLLALAASVALLPGAASAQTKLKMVLNWKYEGPQAWFFLAQDKGYFKAEGLDVSIDQGEGSAASIPKVASGAYDVGFGDMSALIDLAAKHPDNAPVATYMLYNVTPFVVAVKKDSPIKTLKDLEGRTVGGPTTDGALKLFPVVAKAAGVDPAKVKITNMAANLREQMLMRGQVDAAFGYTLTVTFAAKAMGIDPDKELRFIDYADYGIDSYSNALFFSKKLIQENPKAVAGFVRALNRAIKEVIADPDAGMEHVMKREPLLKRDVEKEKLVATYSRQMNHPEINKNGFGDVDDARLKRNIDLVVSAGGLNRTPTLEEVFDRRFLPPRSERPANF